MAQNSTPTVGAPHRSPARWHADLSRASHTIRSLLRSYRGYYIACRLHTRQGCRWQRNLILALVLVWGNKGPAADSAEVEYLRVVKPILQARCYSCHGGLKQESGLRLDSGEAIRLGGDQGPILGEPGSRAADEQVPLLDRITTSDTSRQMPPEGKRLTAEQVDAIRKWIAGGAKSPSDETPEADADDHWAFQPPIRPEVPTKHAAPWVRNPIDAFIAQQHAEWGVKPSAPASKSILLRRVYLDLIGIPPTQRELDAFLNDPSPSAYSHVVDHLLQRPEYGERWGRHWMDVWRYSDWYGRRTVPDCLNSYGQIWRWRDWIVNSLNSDMGYDRMIVAMLAADEIAPDDHENIVATGFLVRNFYRWNYNIWMKDIVEHTGKAFLGLTLNCCHCHDHKYDPISNEEYFRFRAFFEPIEIRHDRIAGEPDPGPYPKYSYGASYAPITSGLVRVMDEKLDAETYIYTGGEARNVVPDVPPVAPGAPAVLGGANLPIDRIDLPATSWYPGLKTFVRQEELAKAEAILAEATRNVAALTASSEKPRSQDLASEGATPTEESDHVAATLELQVAQANVARADAAIKALRARIDADQVVFAQIAGDAEDAARDASRAERYATLAAKRWERARAAQILHGARQALQDAQETASTAPASDDKDSNEDGNSAHETSDQQRPDLARLQDEAERANQHLSATEKGVADAEEALESDSTDYAPLTPRYPRQSSGRRTALARWITGRQNPLTARVAVNHIWLRHFGQALVATTDNLGRSGARPTHPQLLDWLAVELMENGWRMKPIHRLMVTSATYCSSSVATDENRHSAEIDADNRSLWRFNAHRLEAEAVRDAILATSGSLDRSMGGKEVDQTQGLIATRRSLYFAHHGEGRMPFLDLFDAADPCDAYTRTTSTRPQQALAMVNSELVIREGRLLAHRLMTESTDRTETTQIELITKAFNLILCRPPTTSERVATEAFLEQQTRLLATPPVNRDRSTPMGSDARSTDPATRACESFIQALFSHHEFLTVH